MKLWDSLKKKEIEINERLVTMYVCGPTVYDDVHIGNMRPVIIFDILQRLFLLNKQEFFYVQNLTDIDDKIIQRAEENNVSEKDLSNKYIERYFKVLKRLNVYAPNLFVKVSDNIKEIIEFIERLIQKKAAYMKEGNVYFSVQNYANIYGQLSNRDLNTLLVGKRVLIDVNKNYANDFVLWKKTEVGQSWNSPWSQGRPGWHTECALFVEKYFDDVLTIHGGGVDLKFPHHENERIQLLALKDKEPVEIWLHNGHLYYEDNKMSKSLKNFITVIDFLKLYEANVLRYILSTTHYSKPLNITDKFIMQSKQEIDSFHHILKASLVYAFFNNEENNKELLEQPLNSFKEYLQDNLNFANAWVIIKKIVRDINNILKMKHKKITPFFNTLQKCFWLLGLEFVLVKFDEEIISLLKDWKNARTNKEFKLADEIRNKLQMKNVL